MNAVFDVSRYLPLVALCLPMTVAQVVGQAEPSMEFRARLTPEEYEKRVATLDAKKIDPQQVRDLKVPTWGVEVIAVDPESLGEKAGLEVGWVINQFNGREYWNHKIGLAGSDPTDAERTVEAVSPDGKTRREFKFGPGKLGIRTANAHHPGVDLLAKLPAGAWEREMLIAGEAWRDGQQELAETALHEAFTKSMPSNPFSRFYGAMLAMDRGDADLSKALTKQVVAETAENGVVPRFFRAGVRTLALAHGDYDLLRAHLVEVEGFREELQVSTAEAWERRAIEKPEEAPMKRARDHAGEDLLPQVVNVSDGWEKFFRIADSDVLRDGKHRAITRPPDYQDQCFKPTEPIRDLIWEIRGGYGHVQPPIPFHEISFQLVDLKKRAQAAEQRVYHPARWIVAGIRIRREVGYGQTCYLAGGPSDLEIPTERSFPRLEGEPLESLKKAIQEDQSFDLPEEGSFHLALVKVGNEMEVNVNGATYLRLPVDPEVEELGCVIHSTGMALVIEEMSLRPVASF